jgi:hypothetical protein
MENIEQLLPEDQSNDRCTGFKFNYIHSKKDFDELIKDNFLSIINENNKDKFSATCEYMFNVVGYGVFVAIHDKQMHTFIPFANIYSENPGLDSIKPEDVTRFENQKINSLGIKRKYFHRITREKAHWSFSDCIMFYWTDWWRDIELYLNIYYDMLLTVVKERNITSTCFFMNLFDQPVLHEKKCNIYIGADEKCKGCAKHETNPFIPVLSGATSPKHYDKCIVYADAWETASQKKFLPSCRDWYYKKEITTEWADKTSMLTFRGRNSSCNPNDPKKNIRVKVIKSLNDKKKMLEEKGIEYDVGLSGYTTQTLYVNNKFVVSDPNNLKHHVGQFIKPKTMEDQSKSKYILDMDGYVTPWRLCFELGYGSVIILVKSKYTSWFYKSLKNDENIIIVDDSTENIGDTIVSQIISLDKDHQKAMAIGQNSLKLFIQITRQDYILNYMQSMLNSNDFAIVNN